MLERGLNVAFGPLTPQIVAALERIAGVRHVIADQPERLQDYGHDETPGSSGYFHLPDVVVKPGSAAEISEIVRLANRQRIPVTPRGAGSGLSGGAVPVHGGIVLSLERLNHILEVDTANMVVVTEPGVITNDINEAVRARGLFYAGYPMSTEMCFIGGNVAENAGGGRAIKYGVTGRYVLGLEVVLPTGEIVRLGGKRVKDVTGYDLIHLLVGSEGTLGIFTKIILRLVPLPAYRVVLLAPFADVRSAITAAARVVSRGRIIPSAIEFMDRKSAEYAYAYTHERPPRPAMGALLLFEMDGPAKQQVESECNALVDLCMTEGAMDVYLGDTPAKVKQLWRPRQDVSEALNLRYPIQRAEDIVVPPAQIPDLLQQMEDFARDHRVEVIAFGHAGDGNLHLRICKGDDLTEDRWHAEMDARARDLYARVARLGGTISAEHGIGVKLAQYLPLVMDPALIALQRRIKQAFDPLWILNPGKIFPD